MFDAGEGPLDQVDALVGGEQVRGGPVLKQRQGRGQPVRSLLLIAEDGYGVRDHWHQAGQRKRRGHLSFILPQLSKGSAMRRPRHAPRPYDGSGQRVYNPTLAAAFSSRATCWPVARSTSRKSMPGGAPARRRAAFVDSLECLSVTPAIAKQAGLLRRDWQKKGQTPT